MAYNLKIKFVDGEELIKANVLNHRVSDDMTLLEVGTEREVTIIPLNGVQLFSCDSLAFEEPHSATPSRHDTSLDIFLVLPVVNSCHLHRNFGVFTKGPIPGKGGKKFTEAISVLNNNDLDKGFKLLTEAIDTGLEGLYLSYAHSELGQIHIMRGKLGKAVDHFLECLSISDRDYGPTWQSATRLFYIYNAAGRTAEGSELFSLAKEANKKLDWSHTPNVEEELRTLTQNNGFK